MKEKPIFLEKILKNMKILTKTVSYKLQFIDNAIFMASSLSNIVGNHAEVIHKTKSKHGNGNKK